MSERLRILHCMRAPVGGLFRHVRDLAECQARLGHDVGVLCDSSTGGESAEKLLQDLSTHCRLGISRIPMSRQIGPRDYTGYVAAVKIAQDINADILHGHGAKGGAFARLSGRRLKKQGKSVKVFYTPHGGSLHYSSTSPIGLIFLNLERYMGSFTDGMIFESQYSSNVFDQKIGAPPCDRKVIPNGLRDEEFEEIAPNSDAADFLFVGELRDLKGVQVLIDALANINKSQPVRAVLVGAGPDEEAFKSHVLKLGLGDRIVFPGAMPAREAFKLGRCLVVPSFAESFPYIVLEAAAARMPLITTNVGGIPEIYGDTGLPLIAPKNVEELSARLLDFMTQPQELEKGAELLQARVREQFNVERMANEVLEFYTSKLAS